MDLQATNRYLRLTVRLLEKAGSEYKMPVFKRAAEILSRPRRKRVAVNVGKLNRVVNDGDVVLVPGKVLGGGVLSKKVTVAAWGFSRSAIEKIKAAGGEAITIQELIRRRPKGIKIVV